jgi:methylenetetrahydrofolate reductase (NADPH)
MYARPGPTISFEFFPPKNDAAEEALFRDTVPGLKRLGPSFISVTYGAGGGTRERSFRIVDRLRKQCGIEAMAHLTCVGATREDCAAILEDAGTSGIENLLALRGDPPRGQPAFQPTPGGFSYAVDLVRFIEGHGHFTIGVAGYPEGHVECPDKQLDWDRSAAKVHAGASFLITQLFYDLADFLAYEDYLRRKHHIQVPIIPGILPFLSTDQIKRFTRMCGSRLPEPLLRRMESYGSDMESVRQLGVEVCTDLCRQLLAHGVPGIHFYCLNRVRSCSEVLHNLGLAAPEKTPS